MRYHFMDSMRAAMMVAGVFFHAGMVYRPDLPWRFKDPADVAFFSWMTDFLHSFRMPAFFAVAGFFCALMFTRDTGVRKLYSRLIVFGVPFVAMMFTLQPLQYAMKLDFQGVFSGFNAAFWRDYFGKGEYISHLWFLVNLGFYYVAAWLIVSRLRVRDYFDSAITRYAFRSKIIISLISAAFYLPFLFVLRDRAIGVNYEFQCIFQYAPFFVVGYALFRHASLFEQFKRTSLLDVAIMIALVAISFAGPDGRAGRIVEVVAMYQCGFVLTGVCIMVFHRFLNRESSLTRLVSDSAYTIYLLHHFLVVLFATSVAQAMPQASVLVKYSIVVSAVLLLTIAAHQLFISRMPVLKFLFNGRLEFRRPYTRLKEV